MQSPPHTHTHSGEQYLDLWLLEPVNTEGHGMGSCDWTTESSALSYGTEPAVVVK